MNDTNVDTGLPFFPILPDFDHGTSECIPTHHLHRRGMDLRAPSGTRTVKSHGHGGPDTWRFPWVYNGEYYENGCFFMAILAKQIAEWMLFCSYFCCFPHGKSTA